MDRTTAAADDEPYGALVIGVPWEDVGTAPGAEDAGALNILYGAGGGLSASGDQFWSQNSARVNGTVEDFDWFGSALAVGDFDGDGDFDLAVGVPGEGAGGVSGAGVVQVFYSAKGRLTAAGNQIWSQGTPLVEGALELSDGFGAALAAGNFNGDAYDDLAVGVPDEDIDDVTNAGAVNVIYGYGSGLGESPQFWHQDVSGVSGEAEEGDAFGFALVAMPTVKHQVFLPLVLRNY
ncbi:MAG: FG-GAP repeat protein [Anaerolineae bacterium]